MPALHPTDVDYGTLATAFARSPLLMTISAVEDGRYLEVNEAFVRVTGYLREETIGRTSTEIGFISKQSRADLIAQLEAHGRVSDLELELRSADGRPLHCLYSGELIEVDGKTRLLSVATNITEVKQVEARLFESEARFRMLFDHMMQGVVVFSTVEDGADFEVVGANQAMLEMARASRRRFVGQRATAIYAEEGADHHLATLRRVWRSGASETMPVHRHQAGYFDGWYRHSVFRVPSGHVVMVTEDMTAEHAARDELELVRLAVEQAAEAVLITDPGGRIEYVNPAFERVTGYSRSEALGNNPRFLKSGRHSEAFYVEMWSTLTKGEVWRGLLTNRRKDGALITEEAVISPVRDRAGALVSYVAVKRDVSDEHRLEAELRQAKKMEAIGQLTGGVAHDFNNLLQVISGALEFASLEVPPHHAARPEIDEAMEATERAARLVSQLLLFSRRHVMKMATLELDEVGRDMARLLGRVIGEQVSLHYEWGADGQQLHADRGMLEQCLINLCLNARDAMPSGGDIRICTRRQRLRAEELWQPWARAGEYLVLSVQDSGQGIPTELHDRVFEPFFTTKAAGKGTGLGLSTVYGVVKEHRGLVRMQSALGEGSTFELFWPVRGGDAPEVEPKSGETVVEGGSETILLAEDEALVRDVTRRMLQKAGYRVITARDGDEAVACFEDHRDEIDLVVLDAVMPKRGGHEVLDEIRRQRQDVAVLFATGYSERELADGVLNEVGISLVRKPFVRTELLRAVRGALES